MKPKNEPQKPTTRQSTVSNGRFKIEKLEERIAPCHRFKGWYNPSIYHRGGQCRPDH